jgi:hypothetical protein
MRGKPPPRHSDLEKAYTRLENAAAREYASSSMRDYVKVRRDPEAIVRLLRQDQVDSFNARHPGMSPETAIDTIVAEHRRTKT